MTTSPVRDRARGQRDAAFARLVDFLRIPSVSAVPAHAGDTARAAQWVAGALRDAGMDVVRVDPTAGHPVVFASLMVDPNAPTVLAYGHYDVQPPDPVEAWASPPFEPTVRDGAVWARGSSDDKGQVMAHLEAFRMFREAGVTPPVNVKFVVEGEEEVGSPNLDEWLEAHKSELAADVAVVSDTTLAGPNQPSIVVGLRGLVYMEVDVTGPNRDLHSGQFGGAVLNPIHALAEIIAALHGTAGRVTIPGFYDAVRVLTDAERAVIAAAPFDPSAHARATGEAGAWGEAGYSVRERLGARPTLDVNGVWGGWTGAGAKTVIPAAAHAKISMRLVPNQEPMDIAAKFEAHVRALAPAGVRVAVRLLNHGRPCLVSRDLPALASARTAYADVFGVEPVYMLEGGSIPVIASFAEILGVSTVLMGFGLPDDNLHAPDEHYSVENYFAGIETAIAFYEELGKAAR